MRYLGHTFTYKNGYHQNFDGGGTETINQTLIHLYMQAIQMQQVCWFPLHENVFVDIFLS